MPRYSKRIIERADSVGILAIIAAFHTIPLTMPWDETFDIGSDTGTPVDDQDYQVPFRFTGKIDKLTITAAPRALAR
jgi:hypothetical protein